MPWFMGSRTPAQRNMSETRFNCQTCEHWDDRVGKLIKLKTIVWLVCSSHLTFQATDCHSDQSVNPEGYDIRNQLPSLDSWARLQGQHALNLETQPSESGLNKKVV